MNGLVILLVVFVFAVPKASGQLINARSITSFYAWERFDTVGVSETFYRGFQSIILDVAQSNFSLHTHLQASSMLQKTLDEEPDFRFFYLYGKVKNIASVADLSVGRLPFFAGVGNGTLDGAYTTVRFAESKVRLSLYGGANVPNNLALERWGPIKNNSVVGGQLITTAITNLRVGASYINRIRSRPSYVALRADSVFNTIRTLINPEPAKEQILGGDASYRLNEVSLYGRYDYDLNFKKTQRAQFGIRYNITSDLIFTGDYIHRAPRVFFNSFFSVFNASTVNEIEGGVDYLLTPSLRTFVRGAYVKYVDDNTFRYTVGIAHSYVSAMYRGNTGYAGELNSISVSGAYPFFENRLIPNLGVAYNSYTLNVADSRESAFAGILGATVRPLEFASVDVQIQWLRNRVVKNDVRFFAKLNIWFTERLSIFE